MTNLLEKTLLLGFGIFLLMVFSAILIPFLDEFNKYNEKEMNELDVYRDFLNEIDDAVLYIIQNPEESYLQEIKYPNNLNLTFFNTYIISEFIIGTNTYSKTLSYNTSFYNCYFYNLPPQIYLMNVSNPFSNIVVSFINLY
jgi:hypothetical protein